MVLCNLFWGIVNIFCIFPSVVLYTITFPFDQVLKSFSEHPTVENCLHYVFLFTINEFWWGGQRCMSARDGVNWRWSQLDYIEYWVKVFH